MKGTQSAPLTQRKLLLENIIKESKVNEPFQGSGRDLASVLRPGVLVIADLTDPLLPAAEAACIFEVRHTGCHQRQQCVHQRWCTALTLRIDALVGLCPLLPAKVRFEGVADHACGPWVSLPIEVPDCSGRCC